MDAGYYVGILLLSWFIILYLFIHFFLKKRGTAMPTKQKIVLAGKGALFCVTAAAAIRIILRGLCTSPCKTLLECTNYTPTALQRRLVMDRGRE